MAAVMVMAMVVAVEEAMAMVVVMGNGCGGSGRNRDLKIATKATPRGFEPLRAEPNGFLVHLLDRSDTVSTSALARPKPSICAGRLAGTAGTLKAVENREALEISGAAETMEASRACEAAETLARGVYKAFQQLLRGCSKAAARFPEGAPKALTRPAHGFHVACARRVPVSCQAAPADA